MDLVQACRAFVSVGERGSFTAGAAVTRTAQPVVSRRVAALERHLGAPLFERSTRRVALTAFGRDLLPSAQRLVRLADAMEHDAQTARRRPHLLAVPETCATHHLARLVAEARRLDVQLELRAAGPAARIELVDTGRVQAALVAVPAGDGDWDVPLGLATADAPDLPGPVHLDRLRPARTERSAPARRVWVQPEDDVPHVRDRLVRAAESTGLKPTQVGTAASLVEATAAVLGSPDALLCSADQADRLGLHWRPVAGAGLSRSYRVHAPSRLDARRLTDHLTRPVARCLGAVPAPGGRA